MTEYTLKFLDLRGNEEKVAKLFSALSTPLSIYLISALEELNERKPLTQMELAKELYKKMENTNSNTKSLQYYHATTHLLIKKLEELDIVSTARISFRHSTGGARAKTVKLKNNPIEYLHKINHNYRGDLSTNEANINLDSNKFNIENNLLTKVEKIFKALGHKYRLELLKNINEKSVEEIANECSVSRIGLQNHAKILKDVSMIEKIGKRYKRTKFGDWCLNLTENISHPI